jgi:hypothetical protein
VIRSIKPSLSAKRKTQIFIGSSTTFRKTAPMRLHCWVASWGKCELRSNHWKRCWKRMRKTKIKS